MRIDVVNKRRSLLKIPSILVDRSTFLGNPYYIGKDGTREEVIVKYKEYFDYKMCNDPEFRDQFYALCKSYERYEWIQLVCWCAPEACHGDVIKQAMLEVFREREER